MIFGGLVLAIVVVGVFLPSTVMASVRINEIDSFSSNDWVEIHADSDEEIKNWMITDSTTYELKITIEEIKKDEFLVFETSNRLNKNADTVSLFDETGTLIDQIEYGGESGVCVAEEGKTIGRYPDGGDDIKLFDKPTKKATNSSEYTDCTVTPSPAPTNLPTPDSYQQPVQTTNPQTDRPPQNFKTPEVLVVVSAKPTPIRSSIIPSVSRISSVVESSQHQSGENETEVLVEGSKTSNYSGVWLIVSGVFLLMAGLYNYTRWKKRNNQ